MGKIMKHFTQTKDFSKEDYLEIFRRAQIIEDGIKQGKEFTHLCPGKVMATMFLQESTRTSASVQSAIIKLGGGWFGMSGIKGTYLESGEESVEDTLKGVAPLCDIMAVRHKDFDLSALAAKGFRVPLINAMCGREEHSIGAMAYCYFLRRKLGTLAGKKIGFYGLIKSSRPAKAMARAMSHFGVIFYEDAVIPEFQLPKNIFQEVAQNGCQYIQTKLDNFIGEVDCLIVTEGLPQAGEDPKVMEKFNQNFSPISQKELDLLKRDAILIIDEPRAMSDGRSVAMPEVDSDKRESTKEALESIIYTNMALITYLLNIKF